MALDGKKTYISALIMGVIQILQPLLGLFGVSVPDSAINSATVIAGAATAMALRQAVGKAEAAKTIVNFTDRLPK